MFQRIYHSRSLRRIGRRLLRRPPAPPIVDKLDRGWVEQHPGSRCEIILPAVQVTRTLPQTLEPALPAGFADAQLAVVPEQYLARIPNARTVDWHGVVILPDGNFLADAVYGSHILTPYRAYPSGLKKRAEKKRGNYFLLATPFWKNFGHWTHDCMMRLYGIADRVPPDTLYIVPGKIRPYQVEMLGYMGIPPERCVRIMPEDAWELETLYYVPPLQPETTHPVTAPWLRARMLSGAGVSGVPARRIFISRRRAGWSRITNEAEVTRLVESYGLTPYVPEELSFRAQLELFAHVELVVGPHGSGFTNMLFARAGAIGLELFQPHHIDFCMWNNMLSAGHRHWLMMADPVAAPDSPLYDLHVSPAKLADTLDRIFELNGLERTAR